MDYPFDTEDHLWSAVEELLGSPGWSGYVVPSLEATMRADMIALASSKRGEIADDFLRGRIDLANTLLNLLPAKVKEYRERGTKIEVVGADGQPVASGSPYDEANSDGQPVTN